MTFYGKSVPIMIFDDLVEDLRSGFPEPTAEQVQAFGQALLKNEIGYVDDFRIIVSPPQRIPITSAALRTILKVQQQTAPPKLGDLFPGLKKRTRP